VLADCGNNLNTLGKRSASELMQYNGLGFSKVMTILAAVELGRRRQYATPAESPDLGTATRIYNYMHPKMMDLQTEEFWAVLMNQHYRLIKAVRISRGGITETAVDIRIIIRECVTNNTTILAVCHNHPSGSITPSMHDDNLTRAIQKACNIMNLHFLDHVIVTDGLYYSYREQGKI
jgi:DNA repair protein RadC